MNTEFSRIITLLRKEKKLSQKKVAKDLNISQGLLSHYEKGIRECGLDFIIKAADYYDVSCDYILGRTTQRNDSKKTEDNNENSVSYGNSLSQLNKKIIQNSTDLLFELSENLKSNYIEISVSDYLMTSIYKIFRILYSANPQNPQAIFSVPEDFYNGYSSAFQNIKETEINALLKGFSVNNVQPVAKENIPDISEDILSTQYQQYSTSIINLMKIVENNIKK